MAHNPSVIIGELLAQSGLSFERLQSFCRVAAAGGVTRAAGGDPAKQSLFSRQIKELEEFFGADLVKRTGRGVALTEEGHELHCIAREYFVALLDFKRKCYQKPLELSIGAGETLIQWLLPRLPAIRSRFPEINLKLLNLSTAETIQRLDQGRIDLGLVRTDAVTRPLKSVPLGAVTFAAFVPQALAGSKELGKHRFAVLRAVPFATLEGDGKFRQNLTALSRAQKVELNVQLECPSFPIVGRAVSSGKYAAILPSLAAAELQATGASQLHLPGLDCFKREMCLAWNPRLRAVRQLLDKAIGMFQQTLTF